ncbi:unnamed protein product [Blepharisma stoltei]|uniref:Histidine kinase n=1 Tax=Blepharisma stoltei TaxID=1481888 RepID=A0AAU9IML6_9CILI|nr:unnamed protein product [Blepharisma stoltei]
MIDLKTLWWQEETEFIFKFLSNVVKLAIIVDGLAFVLHWILGFPSWKATFIPVMACHFLIAILIWIKPWKKTIHKSIILIIVTEYWNIIFLCFSWTYKTDSRCLFELCSLFTRFHVQFPSIKSRWLFNAVMINHIYIWHIHNLLDSKNIELSILIPLMRILILIFMSNKWHEYILSVSFERFCARKELETMSNKLNSIARACFDGILIVSQCEKIDFLNSRLLELLEATSDGLYTFLTRIEYCKDRKASTFTSSNKLIDDINFLFNDPHQEEITLGITLINTLHLEWKVRSITWEEKPAIFLVVRNVNKIIELENNIANNKLKNFIFRSASHELKTPLNSIIYFTKEVMGNLMISQPLDDMIKKLKIVSISSNVMLTLINDLLDYSKILSGVFKVQKQFCGLNLLIQNVFELMQPQSDRKGLIFISRIDPSIPKEIFIDPVRFGQILLNLVNNAVKNTIKGKIEISCIMTTRNTMKCCVEDTGIGISQHILSNIIKDFESSSIIYSCAKEVGLGLGISNLLVKQLGGKCIKAKSKMGKGSKFSFDIEIFEESINAFDFEKHYFKPASEDINIEMVTKIREFKKSQKHDILVVDDSEFNLQIVASVLKNYEMSFSEALNGRIALEKIIEEDLRNIPYKVVIMDCDMPEMNGWEATKRIHQLYSEGRIKNLPKVIGYSAYTSDEDIKLCFDSGMIGYLPKPCPPDDIIKAIVKYL